MKILVKGNIVAMEGIGSLAEGCVHTVTDFDEKDYDVIITGDLDVISLQITSEVVDVYATGIVVAGCRRQKEKVYIVQENYSCEEENACGDCYDVTRRDVIGVCKSKEIAKELIAKAIDLNYEEYYKVDERDYKVIEAEVGDTADECVI